MIYKSKQTDQRDYLKSTQMASRDLGREVATIWPTTGSRQGQNLLKVSCQVCCFLMRCVCVCVCVCVCALLSLQRRCWLMLSDYGTEKMRIEMSLFIDICVFLYSLFSTIMSQCP